MRSERPVTLRTENATFHIQYNLQYPWPQCRVDYIADPQIKRATGGDYIAERLQLLD
jgi:hypothetical protein